MTTTLNPQEIAAHIDSMDALCERGRLQVKELVGKLFGVKLVRRQPELKAGQVWKRRTTTREYTFLLYKHSDGCLRATTLDGTSWVGSLNHGSHYVKACITDPSPDEIWELAAPDLATYFAEGGKL